MASREKIMSDKLRNQILAIRDSGAVNMFDISGVKQEAQDRKYTLLVIFLETNKGDYLRFIQSGAAD